MRCCTIVSALRVRLLVARFCLSLHPPHSRLAEVAPVATDELTSEEGEPGIDSLVFIDDDVTAKATPPRKPPPPKTRTSIDGGVDLTLEPSAPPRKKHGILKTSAPTSSGGETGEKAEVVKLGSTGSQRIEASPQLIAPAQMAAVARTPEGAKRLAPERPPSITSSPATPSSSKSPAPPRPPPAKTNRLSSTDAPPSSEKPTPPKPERPPSVVDRKSWASVDRGAPLKPARLSQVLSFDKPVRPAESPAQAAQVEKSAVKKEVENTVQDGAKIEEKGAVLPSPLVSLCPPPYCSY